VSDDALVNAIHRLAAAQERVATALERRADPPTLAAPAPTPVPAARGPMSGTLPDLTGAKVVVFVGSFEPTRAMASFMGNLSGRPTIFVELPDAESVAKANADLDRDASFYLRRARESGYAVHIASIESLSRSCIDARVFVESYDEGTGEVIWSLDMNGTTGKPQPRGRGRIW